jgi:adenosylmethionine-8-amino-7-oxononanoate aminotransferase
MNFRQQVLHHKNVKEARCLGSILAVELRTDVESSYFNDLRKKIYPFFLERDILLRPLGNVIYVLPPYVITEDELYTVYRAITDFLDSM